MSDETAEDREHAPSQRKLDEARRQGDVARSVDLASALSLCGFVAAAVLAGPKAIIALGDIGIELLGRSDRLAHSFLVNGAVARRLFAATCFAVGGLFLLPALGSILGYLVQGSWTFTTANLAPRLSRLSPLANARQRFGLNGIAEFAKSITKALMIAFALVIFVGSQLAAVIGASQLSAGEASLYLVGQIRSFVLIALGIALALGLVDVFWQRMRFLARNRMSRKELIDEQRESEGDPHAKSSRRRRAQDLAMNQMMAEVPKADVVVVNPTHYAVALKWDRKRRAAPICLAKGVDELALRIRAVAAEAGVPVRGDPATARAIHATVAVGQEIHPEHYRAVAAAIRFAEAMRRRARARP